MEKAVLGLTKMIFIERWPFYRVATINRFHCYCSFKKKEDSSSMAGVFSKAAVAISSILTANPTASPGGKSGSGSSPARVIESRSKCYKQMHDINSLRVSGVLAKEEFTFEKKAVLKILELIMIHIAEDFLWH